MEKSRQVAEEITNETGKDVIPIALDLSSFSSVRKFAAEILTHTSQIDILINNAGIMMVPETKTEDGNEMQLQVNHLGHFLLTNLLLPTMKKSVPARIINISSIAHQWGKKPFLLNCKMGLKRQLAYVTNNPTN
jgi:NAD(P)-dependent dehydrogenase (short-subunit alcohol dehydrogenase family)